MKTKHITAAIGKKFGRLVIIGFAGQNKWKQNLVHCICECGNKTIKPWGSVNSGSTQSCGCLRAETYSNRPIKHGAHKTSEYKIWLGMRGRCLCRSNKAFRHYGGRGIGICDRWSEFQNFIDDMGPRPPGLEIERINNDGNYEPSNCQWATRKEQTRNTRRNKKITFQGKTMCLSDWAAYFQIHKDTLAGRLERGQSFSEATANAT